jgi:hypothetical protein
MSSEILAISKKKSVKNYQTLKTGEESNGFLLYIIGKSDILLKDHRPRRSGPYRP